MSMTITTKRAIFAILLAVVAGLAFTVVGTPDFAYAKDDGYNYTIRVWAGREGTVSHNGKTAKQGEYVEVTKKYQDPINLSEEFEVSVNNNKVNYFKGFRRSGSDNNLVSGKGNTTKLDTDLERFDVIEDVDFVVSYGVKGSNMVKYTVSFEGNDGKKLGEEEREGKVGDKPVVACRDFEGYTPDAKNKAKTLVSDEKQNTFVFKYYKNATSTSTGTSGGATAGGTTAGGTTAGGTAGGTAAGGTAAGGTAGGTAAGGTAGGTAAGGTEGGNAEGGTAGNTETPTPPVPQEIEDLDNPLADGTSGDSGTGDSTTGSSGSTTGDNSSSTGQSSSAPSGPPYGLIFGIALVLVAIVGGVMYYLRSRRE